MCHSGSGHHLACLHVEPGHDRRGCGKSAASAGLRRGANQWVQWPMLSLAVWRRRGAKEFNGLPILPSENKKEKKKDARELGDL